MTPQPSSPSPTTSPQRRRAISNLGQRLLTGLIAAPIVLAVVVLGGWPFALTVAGFALLALLEYYALVQHRPLASPFARLAVACFGLLYILLPSFSLIALRSLPDGLYALILILALTWGTDTFAYLGGKIWGRHLLAPSISPGKTREGALVGWIGGFVPALVLLAAAGRATPPALAVIALAPLVAIAGDLAESALKRWFKAKDSHLKGLDLLPGHGGILDRIDALLLVALWIYAFTVLLPVL